MVYLTGDTHGNFTRVENFCKKMNTTKDDILVVLGDNAVNFVDKYSDLHLRNQLLKLPITFFLIRGNHDKRPSDVPGMTIVNKFGNDCLWEKKWPNIYYALDGLVYNFDGNQCLVIGGAYSIDKAYRLRCCPNTWFANEQLSKSEMDKIKESCFGLEYDYVLTHTAPESKVPHWMLPNIVINVDNTMELFFNELKQNIKYKKWYCGHYHIETVVDDVIFMYHDYRVLGD